MSALVIGNNPFRLDPVGEVMSVFWSSVGAPLVYEPNKTERMLPQGFLRVSIPDWLNDLHDWLTPDPENNGLDWLALANEAARPRFKVICAHLEEFETLVRLGAPEEAFRELLESLS